jgi:MoaA/NifB/PqqE/SkfB family radical SAM enzyme
MTTINSETQRNLFRGSPLYWERARNIALGSSELDFLSINLRPICNYRCSNCLSGMGDPQEITGTLSTDETQELISQARDLGVLAIEVSGEGEPLVDMRRLEEIIRFNDQLGIITTLFSNGSLLNRENIEYFANNNVSLAISMDYFNRLDYEQDTCRNGSFNQVLNNVILAREIYARHINEENNYRIHRLAIHSIANAQNLNQIPLIGDFCGDDIFYSVAPIANIGNATEHPELTQINQQRITQIIERCSDGNLILSDSAREMHGQDLCGTFIYGIGIRHDGEVLFDAHAFTTSGIIGNIRDTELRELISRQRNLRNLFYERFSNGGFCPLRDPNYQRFVQHIRGDSN